MMVGPIAKNVKMSAMVTKNYKLRYRQECNIEHARDDQFPYQPFERDSYARKNDERDTLWVIGRIARNEKTIENKFEDELFNLRYVY